MSHPAIIESEFIFNEAPFEQCHASTIESTPDGLIASWFGGAHEKSKDVEIWISRKTAGEWAEPVSVANGVQHEGERYPTWNPVLFQMPDGPLMLFYRVGPSPVEWRGMLKTSDDHGKTWSRGQRLPGGILGPAKNKPILMNDGRLICPSSTEHERWRVHFEITRDLGKTWQVTEPTNNIEDYNLIQPCLLKHGGNTLQMLARSKENYIISSWSYDGGRGWGPLESISLPNPNSAIDATTLEDGTHLLVYNHSKKISDEWGGPRNPLNVAISEDGIAWKTIIALEDGSNKNIGSLQLNTETDLHISDTNFYSSEYSYPAVIQTKDRLVHVTYSWKRRRIKQVTIDLSKFI